MTGFNLEIGQKDMVNINNYVTYKNQKQHKSANYFDSICKKPSQYMPNQITQKNMKTLFEKNVARLSHQNFTKIPMKNQSEGSFNTSEKKFIKPKTAGNLSNMQIQENPNVTVDDIQNFQYANLKL